MEQGTGYRWLAEPTFNCKALAIKGAECKKAVHQAFHVAHVDLITSQRDCLEHAGQQDRQHAKTELS